MHPCLKSVLVEVQPSSVQVTYLHSPAFGQERVPEQWGVLERSVMATDDLTLATEQLVILSYRYSPLTLAVMGTR